MRKLSFNSASRIIRTKIGANACGIVLSIFLTGCASSHDLNRDGINFFGGGFIDQKIAPGLYLIKAFSNSLMVATSGAAARTFTNRAGELCQKGFVEIRSVSNSYKASGQRPLDDVKSKIGHVLCNDSPITVDEARALVEPPVN